MREGSEANRDLTYYLCNALGLSDLCSHSFLLRPLSILGDSKGKEGEGRGGCPGIRKKERKRKRENEKEDHSYWYADKLSQCLCWIPPKRVSATGLSGFKAMDLINPDECYLP